MEKTLEQLERARVLSLAREYRKKGYEVVVAPRASALPPFFEGYEPDLWIRRGSDNVAIEVKSAKTIGELDELTRVARSIESQEGWRLELVITNPNDLSIRNESGIDKATADHWLDEAERLGRQGHPEASLLLGWSAAEAKLRSIAKTQAVPLSRPQPTFIVKQLYSRGLLDRSTFELLERVAQARNLVAHGYPSSAIKTRTLSRFFAVMKKLDRQFAKDLIDKPAKSRN